MTFALRRNLMDTLPSAGVADQLSTFTSFDMQYRLTPHYQHATRLFVILRSELIVQKTELRPQRCRTASSASHFESSAKTALSFFRMHTQAGMAEYRLPRWDCRC